MKRSDHPGGPKDELQRLQSEVKRIRSDVDALKTALGVTPPTPTTLPQEWGDVFSGLPPPQQGLLAMLTEIAAERKSSKVEAARYPYLTMTKESFGIKVVLWLSANHKRVRTASHYPQRPHNHRLVHTYLGLLTQLASMVGASCPYTISGWGSPYAKHGSGDPILRHLGDGSTVGFVDDKKRETICDVTPELKEMATSVLGRIGNSNLCYLFQSPPSSPD